MATTGGTSPPDSQDPTLKAPSGPLRAATSVPPEAAAAPTSARFGKFIRTQKLGAGGMGEVWKAWDAELNRWVALKFLKGQDADEIVRFKREAQTAARLNHPTIAAIYDVGFSQERHYIAMQFIDGQTLKLCPRTDRRAVAALIRDAARAVHYAHDQGIVHRDIKPENLMVGARGALFVMDFGLARPTEGASNLSASGLIVGTPAYMAPEQARGERVDRRADVYGLGATLYELLANRPPFQGASVFELIAAVQAVDPVPPRRINPKIDRDLDTIVMKALEKEPSRRYATAAELADDIDRWLDGAAVQAHPPSMLYRLRKLMGRRRAIVIAVACTLVVALTGSTLITLGLRGRRFSQFQQEASSAYTAGRWSDALAGASRALEIRRDDALARIADDCRARLAAEERDKQARIAQGERYRVLKSKLEPIERLLHETRPMFYIKDFDIRDQLEKVERGLVELQKLARDPMNAGIADVWLALGTGWYFIDRTTEAEQALLKAEKIAPDDGRLAFYLGRLYLDLSMKEFLGQRPQEDQEPARQRAETWREKAFTYLKRSGKELQEVDSGVLDAYRALAENRTADAVRHCEEGQRRLGKGLGSEEYWLLLGVLRAGDERIAAYTLAIDRRPCYPQAIHLRGIALLEKRDPRGAHADYDRLVRINPKDDRAWLGRGAAKKAMKDSDGAVTDFTEAVRLNPENREAHFERGELFAMTGKYDAAIADYQRALDLRPNDPSTLNYMGLAWRGKGDVRRSIDLFTRAIAAAPRYGWPWLNRAASKTQLGDYDGAIEDMTQAIACMPENPLVYSNRGTMRLRRGDPKLALPDYTRAIELLEGGAQGGMGTVTGSTPLAAAYQGRAKAKAMTGDGEGASKDAVTSAARGLSKDDAHELFNILWRADVQSPVLPAWMNDLIGGDHALAAGRRDDALALYERGMKALAADSEQRAAVEQRLIHIQVLGAAHYRFARCLSHAGRTVDAAANLVAALDHGFGDTDAIMKEADLKPLRDDAAAWKVVVDRAKQSSFLGVESRRGAGGVEVVRVTDGSPAAAAGLRVGDVIASVDGFPIPGIGDLQVALGRHRAGDRAQFVVLRDGARQKIEVVLGRRPGS